MNERYFIEKDDAYLGRIVDEVNRSRLMDRFHAKKAMYLQRYYEIVPGEIVATIAPNQFGHCGFYAMVWGFNLGDPLRETHSVKIENIEKDSRYSEDFRKHRCVLPASYFVERKHIYGNDGSVKYGKDYIVQPAGAARTFLCGFYRIDPDERLPYCVLLSAPAPSEYRKEMSDRIPLIISDTLVDDWINPEANPKDIITQRITDFIYQEEYVRPAGTYIQWY